MIDFQRAHAQRRLLRYLTEKTSGFALVSMRLREVAAELGMSEDLALALARELRAKGLLTLAVPADLREARVWVNAPGLALLAQG